MTSTSQQPQQQQHRQEANEYFVVLPSNSCPKVHPDNTASKFIVSWENPLVVDTNWQVALTEMSYNFTPMSSNESFGVAYTSMVQKSWTCSNNTLSWSNTKEMEKVAKKSGEAEEKRKVWHYKFSPGLEINNKVPEDVIFQHLSVSMNEEEKFVFTAHVPFTISSRNLTTLGFVNTKSVSSIKKSIFKYEVVAMTTPTVDKADIADIIVTYTFAPVQQTNTVTVSKIETVDRLMNVLTKDLSAAFSKAVLTNDRRIQLTLHKNVKEVRLLNSFHEALGFKKYILLTDQTIMQEEPTFMADYVPQLTRGIDHMYIYASCCATTRVGDVQVPLLRNFFIENNDRLPFENPYGKSKNFIIRNPMYMPLSSTSINNIEINIRDDAGRLINFDESAKTSLTLHFKQQQQ